MRAARVAALCRAVYKTACLCTYCRQAQLHGWPSHTSRGIQRSPGMGCASTRMIWPPSVFTLARSRVACWYCLIAVLFTCGRRDGAAEPGVGRAGHEREIGCWSQQQQRRQRDASSGG